MPTRQRAIVKIAALSLLALASFAAALLVGSFQVAPADVLAALFGQEGSGGEVVLQLRLPRAIAGFACGGLLALAGALMQVLLRNPLADPYVLGISGGAGVGALLTLLLGVASLTPLGALIGALAAMALVFGLSHGDGSWTQTRLLLTGVIVASGCGALVSLILSIAPEHKLHGMLFWLMGDLAQVHSAWLPLGGLAVLLCCALPLTRDLNVLGRGQDTAQALGVNVPRLRRWVYFLASAATALTVTSAGSIGFIGLVVPHLVRLACGADLRLQLPASVLAGGGLLVLADTAARTLIDPQQLPVGVLTALIGVPVFLFLLSRQPRCACPKPPSCASIAATGPSSTTLISASPPANALPSAA